MGKDAKSNTLDHKGKVRLLRSWLHYLYEATNSWELESVGSDIAYLCKAVLDDEKVEWRSNNPVNQLILKKDPKCKSVIWRFIKLVPNE